eukprot:TRINITY_DN32830_c0_g1_i1.p1 TRINITY_DN32830_c0_g1~~TRINITY_DN32830_c0_g1_i1.p1  ORF type:complete len:295 (-),score=52.75 TRINITY_DN32830_c0_g1_i1:42-926(-)
MHTLRVCQFNVLAPSARICKPLDRTPWRDRHTAICHTILGLSPALCTIQEFDFETSAFRALYSELLGEQYELHTKQRPGGKQEGLAVLLRRGCWAEVSVDAVELEPRSCDRVAILVTMRHVATGRGVSLANTHLTVAHASNGRDIPMCRPRQMEQVLCELAARQQGGGVCLCCADLNADHLETADPGGGHTAADCARPIRMAFEAGFESALHQVLPEGSRPMSHTCSYAQDGCCDYVLYEPTAGLELQAAFLHPESVPQDQPWSAEDGWGPGATLSDHRPLVVDFQITEIGEHE